MVPLVVRSHCSLMWGTSAPEHLPVAARQHGYRRVALTDTDNLYGLWPFLQACREEDVTPIVGAEVSEPGSRRRVVCLVENDDGYRNLCRLITRRHCNKDFYADCATCPPSRPGFTCLVPSCGSARAAARSGGQPWPRLCRAGHRQARPRRAPRPVGSACPRVAVPSSFFLVPDDLDVHRLLRAIALNTSLSRLKPSRDGGAGLCAPADAWLAPPAHYERRFDIWPETLARQRRGG